MVKALYFIKRKPGMALLDFRRYWLNDHANIVRKVPELKRYVQSHTLESGYRKHEPVYDGIAELWYEDTAAMRRIAGTPQSRAAADDDANFIDMSKFDFILADEVVQKNGHPSASAVKMIAFLNRKPGTEVDKFQAYWRGTHGPLASKVPQLVRYVQCHVRKSAYAAGRSPRYDGVAESWFASVDAMRESGQTPEYLAVRSDEPNFLAPTPIPFIIADEHRIV